MYKNFTAFSRWDSCVKIKIVRMIKLTCIVLFIAVLQVSAGTYAQKLTLRFKDAPMENVLLDIRQQSGYDFLYSAQLLKKAKPVTMDVKGASIEQVLKSCMAGQPLSYVINKNTVTITAAPAPVAPAVFPVTGRVVDEKGIPLPGVSVKVKGTATGAMTDADGKFALNAPDDQGILVFSYVGYESLEKPINSLKVINVVLAESAQSLNDVVVVGYGTQKRTSVTGAVDQITSAAIEGKPAMNVTQALQGVSPNLIVQQSNPEPGAGASLNIRGVGTMGDNSPLVVIDGIVGGDINLLNPSDIQSVSVLKDAGSAAIYGSRSANGVILVTTKQGAKNSSMKITLNALAGLQTPHVLYKPVKGYENAILRNEANVNAGQTPIYNAQQIRDFKERGDEQWFLDAILQNALQQNHNLSVSGGNAQSTYLVSIGYADQRNNLVGPDYGLKRYNYRINLNNEYGKFKLNSILSYSKSMIKDHSSNTSTLIVDAGRVPTIFKLKDDQGRYLTNEVLAEFNPLGQLEQGGYRKYDNDNLFGSLTAEYAATDYLKFRGIFGGTLTSNHLFARTIQVNYFPQGISGADRNTNDENNKNLFLNTQFIAEFNKTFNKSHAVSVLLGVANESANNEGNRIYRRFTDPELGTPITGTVIDPSSQNTNQATAESSLNSVFGRANYSFNDKYYAEANFRVDGSSKFSRQNRWGFFPAVSAGYRLSQEDFMKDYQSKFGDVKIRGSYGILGNQNVGNYQFQTTYFNIQNSYAFGDGIVSGTGFNFSNPDIRWERAATFNIGADLTFFKNSLNVSVDYFDKITRDILVQPVVPGVFGASLPDFNSAEMQNRGWELSVSYRLNTDNFKHVIGLNLGDSKNKVRSYSGRERIASSDEMQYIIREGLPFNSYVGLKTDGYFQTMEEVNNGPKPAGLTNLGPGDIRYVDVNKDGVIDDKDRYVLGNAFPRYTFGFTYALTYKNFDMNLFIQGVGKRNAFIRGEMVEPYHFNYGQVAYEHQLDYWRPDNTDARYPRLAANGSQSNTNNFRKGSDAYIYNAAYARLKNVQIGYSLSPELTKKLGMQKFRVYASGQNLLTLSGLKFLDPENTEFNGNLSAGGANSARAYPTPIYVGMGLDVTF